MKNLKELFWTQPAHFLTVKDVAGRLGKSETTIRRWIRLGNLEAVRIGRTLWVYLPSAKREIRDPDDVEDGAPSSGDAPDCPNSPL